MSVNRRKFLQSSALAGAGLAIPTAATANAAAPNVLSEKPKSKINVGIIGSGFRGQGHIDLLLRRSDCEVTAVAEIDERMLGYTRKIFDKASTKEQTNIFSKYYIWGGVAGSENSMRKTFTAE